MGTSTTRTDLEIEILVALGRGPLHGYGIIQDIEGRTPAFGDLRSGTLYLALRRLREDELITACDPPSSERGGDARRKFVRLTDAGRSAVRDELERRRRLLAVAVERDLLEPGTA